MFKFFKGRESTHVKSIRASRAMYISPDVQEINIEFIAETGEHLTLQLTPDQARDLILHMTSSYQAIRPPLRGNTAAADWEGMR